MLSILAATEAKAEDVEDLRLGQGTLVAQQSDSALEGEAGAKDDSMLDEDELALGLDEEFGEEEDEAGIPDPFEPINRVVFNINDKVYIHVAKPVYRGYSKVFPEWGRRRVDNFFLNVTSPITFVGNVLQFKMNDAGTDLARFLINSTLGIGGLFDVAGKHMGLKSTNEDLGQTFGRWGLGDGFYLVLPLLGPSSLRDTAGMVGDSYLNPIRYLNDRTLALSLAASDEFNNRSFVYQEYEEFKEAAIDPYVALRDAYFQYRRDQIKK